VLLDADMLVRRNMDELFDLPLDKENCLFAATRMCPTMASKPSTPGISQTNSLPFPYKTQPPSNQR
jgi:alpha-N-acetylglucosamine transferase